MLNIRSILCTALLLMPISCYAQSILVDQVLYSGAPDPQFNATNSTSPDIAKLESFLQNLPPATPPPFWPFGGYILYSDGVSGFPEQVEVFQGVIRIFANGIFFYYQDVNGLESYLNSLFFSLFGTVDPPIGGQPSSTPGTGGADPLPRSGGEPPFDPAPWNEEGILGTQLSNNCYNYALNKLFPGLRMPAQPGTRGGRPLPADRKDWKCNNVLASAIADGLIPWVANVPCPADKFKMALVVDPGRDYHWYRQDSSGNWSHKRGRTAAKNVDDAKPPRPITDPRTANRDGYVNFCAFMCVRSDPAAVNIAFVLPASAKEFLSYLF